MFNRLGAVSLLALTLVAGAALAQDAPPEEGQTQEEGAPAVDVPAPEVPAEILTLLGDMRPATELSDGELRDRARSARAFSKQQGLTDDIRGQLQQMAKDARAELDARGNKPKEQEQSEQPGEQPAQEEQPPAAEQAAPEEKPAEQPAEAAPAEQTENTKKKKKKKNAEEQSQPTEEAAPAAEEPPAAVIEQPPVQEAAPPPEDPPAQLEQTQEAAPPPEQAPVVEEQPAAKSAEPAQPPPPPVVDKKEVQELDSNAGNPEAEAKARAFLDDATPADSLKDDDLRSRLDAMRDLMEGNQLSQKTERALRKKLRADRQVLRARKEQLKAAEEAAAAKKAAEEAAAEAAKKSQENEGASQSKGDRTKIVIIPQITINTPPREILRDRRRSEELTEDELRRRVNVYRDVESEEDYLDYDPEVRDYWRQTMRRDRELLRRRLLEDRRQREEELALNEEEDDFIIEDDFQPGRKVPRNVFEAEADDEELEEVLISPPKKKVRQRYTAEEIGDNESLREAMPRIEVDTIRFGFNEAFVREEEVENLDRIAAVIERVLKKRPREVFLIEGHTDAVGSDAYNLRLSRARAEAIKKALTSYYVISPRNLQTVGLGERYLKIPTAEPEAENRRVSISRATPLVGELEE